MARQKPKKKTPRRVEGPSIEFIKLDSGAPTVRVKFGPSLHAEAFYANRMRSSSSGDLHTFTFAQCSPHVPKPVASGWMSLEMSSASVIAFRNGLSDAVRKHVEAATAAVDGDNALADFECHPMRGSCSAAHFIRTGITVDSAAIEFFLVSHRSDGPAALEPIVRVEGYAGLLQAFIRAIDEISEVSLPSQPEAIKVSE